MPHIEYDNLKNIFKEKLLKYSFSEEDATVCANIFADNSLYGVLSHGANRFPAFIELIENGVIKVDEKPSLVESFNAVQQWDGNYGPGPLNALFATEKVMNISDEFGIGCIGLKNTNHWMRPGYYGWYAAEKGYILICWTNTIPNLPAYGAKESTTGNNPIVFAAPYNGKPVVLDMALSQFSYGSLATYKREGKQLPIDGGYDTGGNVTTDPAEIYKSQRPFPVGHWKGAGLSLLLDLIATILSGGRSTYDLSKLEHDSGMSQVFIAINPQKFQAAEAVNHIVDQTIEFYKSAETIEGMDVFYPGERALQYKEKYLKDGIPVSDEILKKIEAL